jgi:hypothetical protein
MNKQAVRDSGLTSIALGLLLLLSSVVGGYTHKAVSNGEKTVYLSMHPRTPTHARTHTEAHLHRGKRY